MTNLKIGDSAPEIHGEDENGNVLSLSSFSGRKLILYFYPNDDTPTCTKEACNLRDNYELLMDKGFEVLGVSADTAQKHHKFISKYTLPFRLLVDPDMKTIHEYGVFGPKKFMGRLFDTIHRITFVIDENGQIESIIENVKSGEHAHQILNELSMN
ncbi:thioredoxin-dependent thiol peroxidase [Crocinitomix catalasitica]|nr:thioredoxin-dependent thiol peroxidase [Crocinitomix catalasitica]